MGKLQILFIETRDYKHVLYSIPVETMFHSLTNDKCLDQAKFKAFADDNSNVDKMVIFSVKERVENIVRKGENAGYQHFLLFPQCFQKASFPGSLKVGILW